MTESSRELGAQLIEKLRSEGLVNVDRLFDGVKLVSENFLFLQVFDIYTVIPYKEVHRTLSIFTKTMGYKSSILIDR